MNLKYFGGKLEDHKNVLINTWSSEDCSCFSEILFTKQETNHLKLSLFFFVHFIALPEARTITDCTVLPFTDHNPPSFSGTTLPSSSVSITIHSAGLGVAFLFFPIFSSLIGDTFCPNPLPPNLALSMTPPLANSL